MAAAGAFSPAILHYFDGRGRAEPIRWMLEETGTPYTENIIRTREDMSRLRSSGKLLYNQVPMLEIDGLCIVQCEAILRYLARKNDMLGADLAESARVDMVHAATNDIRGSMLGVPFNPPQARPAMLQQCLETTLPKYLAPIERLLQQSKTGWVAGGGGLTLADVTLCEALCMVTEAPHAAADILKVQYPAAHAHMHVMLARPRILQYSSSGRRRVFSGDHVLASYSAQVRASLS
eukprot:Tamp_28151.p1 GENE.Tamp_28151~~Tamp_28151.p1  ORF type:complete len:260 (+),score=46.35 Tamp_28151:77-781(+)